MILKKELQEENRIMRKILTKYREFIVNLEDDAYENDIIDCKELKEDIDILIKGLKKVQEMHQ